MDKEELWQAALAKIELSLSRPSFLTWFQETGISHIDSGVATVFVPNGFAREWLQNKYHKTILHAIREISSDVRDIHFMIGKPAGGGPSLKSDLTKKKRTQDSYLTDDAQQLKEFTVHPETNLNPRYVFSNFVVGSFNELAHAAAQSVIKNPGTSYNPLFIYGGVGLGKTHLIQAIGNEVLRQNSQKKVRYVSSEKYMGEVVDALRNQEMNALKEKYRSVDLLIMDDIQFVARTEKMQEEFFHTFNALYEKNKQIIISSDRPPQAISTLEERLRSRFEGGMIADVGTPDVETRFLIIKTKADEKGVLVPEDALRLVAERIKTNIRELEGVLNKIVINSKLSNSPVTKESVEKILVTHSLAPKKFVSGKKIIKVVCDFYEIKERDLVNSSRKKDFVRPRQIAMYLMRDELKYSYPSIGDRFGGRDHTTAIHSCEKIAEELKRNFELEEEIRLIKERIFSE